jgi:hypothetical protein
VTTRAFLVQDRESSCCVDEKNKPQDEADHFNALATIGFIVYEQSGKIASD